MSDYLAQFSIDQLRSELRARAAVNKLGGAAAKKPDEKLKDVDSGEILDRIRDEQKLVYGTDDRRDLFEVINPKTRNDCRSVVSLVKTADLTPNGDGTSTLQVLSFKDEFNLCGSERYASQPIGAFCSAVLVAKDIIATAGHCIRKPADLATTRFVFGFHMLDVAKANLVIPDEDIHEGVNIINRVEESNGPDWALIKLKGPVANRPIAQIRRASRIPDQQRVHVIGHPCGLPLKIAAGARVRDNTSNTFFVANLDTYGGNSGSPVFNSSTHEVEGLLVRGDTDFHEVDGCNLSVVCPNTGCRGEDVTRSTEFSKLVP